MKRTYLSILFFCITTLCNSGGRGIVLPCNDHYMKYAVPHLTVLRSNGCDLPIEIWYAGDELSEFSKNKLQLFSPISFKDIAAIHGREPNFYQGWQIKGFAVGFTHFDEVFLVDADVCLFQSPDVLFEHPKYKETGTYLFRDEAWGVQGGSENTIMRRKHDNPYYYKRKEYLQSVIDKPSKYLPNDWTHYWDNKIKPTNDFWIGTEHGESGCVLINRLMHKKGVQKIVDLNCDYENTYKLFFGDKETFWLAFEIEKEPYYMNSEFPKSYFAKEFDSDSDSRAEIIQFVDGEMFYQQKAVIKPIKNPQFIDLDTQIHPVDMLDYTNHYRYLTDDEVDVFYKEYFQSNISLDIY